MLGIVFAVATSRADGANPTDCDAKREELTVMVLQLQQENQTLRLKLSEIERILRPDVPRPQ